MVIKAQDPITGTTWFDPSDIGGSGRTMLVASIGVALLLVVVMFGFRLNRFLSNTVSSVTGGGIGTPTGIQLGRAVEWSE